MPYTYTSFETTDANDDLWKKIETHLNGLTEYQSVSVKIAASNQNDGKARAVVYYTRDKPSEGPKAPTGPWLSKVFSTDSDYDKMYQDVMAFLNGSDPDGPATSELYWSRISMTNAHTFKSNIVVWYRKD